MQAVPRGRYLGFVYTCSCIGCSYLIFISPETGEQRSCYAYCLYAYVTSSLQTWYNNNAKKPLNSWLAIQSVHLQKVIVVRSCSNQIHNMFVPWYWDKWDYWCKCKWVCLVSGCKLYYKVCKIATMGRRLYWAWDHRKNICCQKIFGNSFSFQATEMVLTSKRDRI